MPIVTTDGFKIYTGPDKFIIINSDYIKEGMQFFLDNDLDGVAITIAHDYKLSNVDFLAEYPQIKRLSISDGIEDISAIHNLKNLETLSLSGKKKNVDFSHFPLLKKLIADWSPNFSNMDVCVNLESLSLYNFSPKTKNCLSLSGIPWIRELKISQSTIINFNGLERFNCLEKLTFYYCSKLEELCCLEESKETLTSILFDHCKSIKNYDYVKMFSHLNTLSYNDGGILPSIKFIKDIPSLQDFIFVGTNVTDGDMTPCIGLKYAGFSNKKNFSHSPEEIKSLTDLKFQL